MLLAVCAALAVANGLVNPTLNGLASQMIDRSWQGRALGLMQSAGSVGRLVGPLLGGWLLMFDLDQPLTRLCAHAVLRRRGDSAGGVRTRLQRPQTNRGSNTASRLRRGRRLIRGTRDSLCSQPIPSRSPAPVLAVTVPDEANTSHPRRHWPRHLGCCRVWRAKIFPSPAKL